MNWTKILLSGIVGGVFMNIADFVMHGVILGNTYMKHTEVFSQVQANPLLFLVISLLMSFFAALLFAKTRDSWAGGWKGGATFGFFLGLVFFFAQFGPTLVIDSFPYHLSWCLGGT